MQESVGQRLHSFAMACGLFVGIAAAVAWMALTDPANAQADISSVAPRGAATDWPMYRHDPGLSAVSPVRGSLGEKPEIAWSLDLGGPHVVAESLRVCDVIGDGREEFITLRSDTVTCRDSRGKQLWKLDNFLNPSIVDVRDFVGDGSRGILMTTTRAGRIDAYMVSGRTGKATHLWLDENNFGGHTRIGRLLADVAGVQIAETASGQTPPATEGADIRLVSFDGGLDHPHFHVRQHVTGVIYSPIFLFADLAGDGGREMVVISHEQIWTFDVRTGRQTFYAAYGPAIRTYWATVAAVKLRPQDRSPALIMINPHLPGLKAVEQDGKTFARELWKVVIGGREDQYQKQVVIGPAGPSLVYDLDGDGRNVVLVSVQNEHGDGQKRLVVVDSLTGKRMADLPGADVLAADDLDGDGKPEFLLRRGSELHICRWKSTDFQSLWHGVDVVPVLHQQSSEGDLGLTSGMSAATTGNVTVWRAEPGSHRFLLRFPDGVHRCRLTAEGLEKGPAVGAHEALGNLTASSNPSERVVWDGSKLVTLQNGREVYRYEPPTQTNYLAPPPLVADLDGKRRILVRSADGSYLVCTPDGKKERSILERASETPQLLVDAFGAGPMVGDVDGDGENDIVATIADAQGRPVCVILDGHGKEKRRLELLPGMTAMNRGPTGRLGPGRGRWLLLRMSGEGPDHEHREIVVAYDGKSGKQLWTRDHYGQYGQTPVVCRPHFPSAVVDYDNDGADDWLICSENFYGVISVKDNKDLVGPVVLSDALPGHWTAYSFPSLAPGLGDDKPVVFHHNSYSLLLVTDLKGQPFWHFGMTRDTAGTWGQIVDFAGDRGREIVHAQPDGMLRCFPLEPLTRCPSCPPDARLANDKRSSERWQMDLSRPASRMIAADLVGDGRTAVLFGGDDGELHAVGERDGKPRLLWSVPFGRRVGEPILAEIGGQPSILVTTDDGRLHCLTGK
jgi:outer membrane protein assembly factor BamB